MIFSSISISFLTYVLEVDVSLRIDRRHFGNRDIRRFRIVNDLNQ